ncbi:meckelin isoform x1 [Plasmopara halstedii]|uniref:Meckelin isoform x1 n=1 Tax=Plasmopara halstedii TaxID=4781 RepID=A0A0P1AW11_PLAHL|nr:meckelin isoform x1 [Plasmopara halstedii]CEG45975.1 meckelin isoform x1 [Plasmopara halstedii]|eukprot:XP_024582344.1 meckelin isoform x1 [Plasmopara halstedii]
MKILLAVLVPYSQVEAQVKFPTQFFVSSRDNNSEALWNGVCNASTEFYDQSALKCSRCVIANGALPISNAWLIPDYKNAQICTCNQDAIQTNRKDSTCEIIWPMPCSLEVCTSCPTDQVPSRDSSRCMACGDSTLGQQKLTRECKCAANSIVREKNESGSFLGVKECVACTGNTVADKLTNTCIACPDPLMVVGGDDHVCACPDNYQLVTSSFMNVKKCVGNSHISLLSSKVAMTNANKMIYSSFIEEEAGNSVSVASAFLEDMFLCATTGCYYYQSEKDIISCQALGNLCVLQHFDPNAPSCSAFDLIRLSGRSPSDNNIKGWYATLPFLHFSSEAFSAIQSSVAMKMTFDAESNKGSFEHLDFILASYNHSGTLIGFKALVNELTYCQVDSSTNVAISPSWMRFGVSAQFEYSCNLKSLQTASVTFYELFLVDLTKGHLENGRYIPIPVKNLNYRDASGMLVNQDSDAANDFLSHRFFLFDLVSGIALNEDSPDVIRYVKDITLTIRSASDPHFIEVPQLSIAYVDTVSLETVPVSFRVVYTSSTDELWAFAKVIFTVGCVFAGLRMIVQTFKWYRRSIGNEVVENAMYQILLGVLNYAIANVAPVSFAIMIVLCGYIFTVFRLQSSTILMLPNNDFTFGKGIDEYYSFRILLLLAFFCQLVSVFRYVYRQAQVRLFFIDWEKPRTSVMDIDTAKPIYAPISVWRMILVANEWNKMQTIRKTSLRFTLLCILFLLYGCNLKILALPIPKRHMQHAAFVDAAEEHLNPYLRFANVTIWWLLISMCQRLWKWMIFERYIEEPREQLFIDLCTISKISLIFLDETYHGFYLHCRSPHAFADGSMGELVDQLKQEEAGLTAGRYLDSAFPECQAFEMFVTRKWTRKFHTLISLVRGDNFLAGHGGSGERLIQRSFSPKRPDSRSTALGRKIDTVTTDMVRNVEQLRNFLQSFVENQNDRFRWRIYRAHTCLTRFLDIPPDMSFSKQSFFLPDMDSKFATASLLLGIENDLMLMDLLCFCQCDLWFDNHAISALVTYALQHILLFMRAHFSRRNIAKSSLVDSRFLI